IVARRRDIAPVGPRPGDLRRTEIGIEQEARRRLQGRLVAGLLQPRAIGGGAPVLPDDRRRERASRPLRPEDDRLALVGDADGGDAATALGQFARAGERCAPDFLGVMLDPAGPGIGLAELARLEPEARPVQREQHRARARRPRVDDKDRLAGHALPLPRASSLSRLLAPSRNLPVRVDAGKEGRFRRRPNGAREAKWTSTTSSAAISGPPISPPCRRRRWRRGSSICRSISASNRTAPAASRSGPCSTCSAPRPISTSRSGTRRTARRRAASWIWRRADPGMWRTGTRQPRNSRASPERA